jgi:hypothetical protein
VEVSVFPWARVCLSLSVCLSVCLSWLHRRRHREVVHVLSQPWSIGVSGVSGVRIRVPITWDIVLMSCLMVRIILTAAIRCWFRCMFPSFFSSRALTVR